jgi:hypothetical protein
MCGHVDMFVCEIHFRLPNSVNLELGALEVSLRDGQRFHATNGVLAEISCWSSFNERCWENGATAVGELRLNGI